MDGVRSDTETCEAPPEGELIPARPPGSEGADTPLRYAELRSQLRDGDLVLFRGKNILSRLIVAASKGQYSHVALILWWGGLKGRLMVVEAHWPGGLRAVPLSWVLCEYRGHVDIYRLRPELRLQPGEDPSDRGDRPFLHRGALLGEATYLLGRDFAVYDLFRVGMRHLFGWPWPKDADGARDFFCSEYISRVLQHAGLDPAPDEPDLQTTPTDLARCSFFERLGPVQVLKAKCLEQRKGLRDLDGLHG